MTLYLVLYLATLVIHVALVSYVLVGAGWLAIAREGAIRDTFKDWLPFAIGAAITAGVAPLLFVQILYQERFYTANLLLAHRWLAVIPALIIGFYAAYLAKARGGRVFPMIALACFVFVAFSWTENHLLSLRSEREWAAMYGASEVHHFEPALVPRLLLWLGLAAPTAATMLVWQVPDYPKLRGLAFGGLGVAGASAAWLYATLDDAAHDALLGGPGTALAAALAVSLAIVVIAWLRRARAIASIGMLAALVLGAILRERLRLPLLDDHLRPRVEAAGGMLAFFFFFAVNTGLVIWCVRSARRHAR